MPGLIQIFKFSLGVEGNEAHEVIVPWLSCYVHLAGEEPWDQPGPFLCSFPIALHCRIPKQTSTCHLALFSSSLSSFGCPPVENLL